MDCFLKIWTAAFRSYALKYALLLPTPLKNFKEEITADEEGKLGPLAISKSQEAVGSIGLRAMRDRAA